VKDANTAVTLDGTNDYITAGDNHGFAGTAGFTVDFWVKPTAATGQYRRLVSKEKSSGGGWSVHLASTAGTPPNRFVFLREDAGGSERASSSSAAVPGTWYHVAATYDGTTMKIYINGVLEDSNASSRSVPATTGMPLVLGGTSDLSKNTQGTLDEVAIYPSALTATQVVAHYNAGLR